MKRLASIIRSDKEFDATAKVLTEQLRANNPLPLIINGLTQGAQAHYLSEILLEIKEKLSYPSLIIVGSDSERARISSLLSEEGIRALEYKPRDFVFYNISASHDLERERLSVLSSIISGEADVIVTTLSAAVTRTMPRGILSECSLGLRVGDEISLAGLTERLSSLGAVRVDTVESAGQFSVRGGIVDVWTGADINPVRIELFGDEIDRMVSFDPITQRSLGAVDSFKLLPACEVIVDNGARERIRDAVASLLKKADSEETRARLNSEKSTVEAGLPINFRDKYISLIYEEYADLFSYFDTDRRSAVFFIDTNGAYEELKTRNTRLKSECEELIKSGLLLDSYAKYTSGEREIEAFLSAHAVVHINSFSGGLGNLKASGLFGFRCRRSVSYGDNPSMLIEDINAFRKSGYRTVILCESRQGAESLISSLMSQDIAATPIYDRENFDYSSLEPGQICVDIGQVSEGYELITPKIAVLSMARDSGRAVMANRRRQRILKRVGGAGERLMSYADLSVGDYVVHANYGIGLFEGIETVSVDGVTKDYITIKYAGTDKLFVPCDRLEYIGKYIGEKDKNGEVKLSRMGGAEWNKTKTRAKSAAKDIAKNLIMLYAERQRKPGFAFSPDTDMEDEFAASFDYEETDSQLQAIEEIKADMMKPVPMNRLLCGDVGFGKTEVALRAAFKAVMDSKQVAILVPTTILAMQHYETALSRMRSYPITVEMLTRFRTPKEQQATLRRVKRGECDILIGTHKMLSGKVEFRDLGLLIVDEEQRFGVSQKEKLKELAKNVDTLTLTATPIPRTLNMAMNGISDMSILDEAPGDRLPVQTYVLEYDEGIIFDAMKRELARGGQVLYLYNKVEDISFVSARISHMLPDARVTFAHGQMDRDELEDIWRMLVGGEIDILVCTTIIETGIDLPSANTLIIENADRMGLSQLHQIRGRVGRSSRQAYAYFTYRPGKALSEIATKRLAAIREFAEFGAGFKVALRDLEIRGAGNLLGAEQHGYIDSIGYDLYVRLLSEAVLEERGETKEAPYESTVDIAVSANIPERYIPVSSDRMQIYKKISLIREPIDMQDILDELIDRFGDAPRECLRLVRISLIRALAPRSRIKRVEYKNSKLIFSVEKPELAVWSELFAKYKGLSFRGGGAFGVECRARSGDEAIELAAAILTDYTETASDIKKEEKKDEK